MASDENAGLEPKNILVAVSQIGIVGHCPFLAGELCGGECRVFKLSFGNEASVAVRVPHPDDNNSHDNTIATLQTEVNILKTLEAKGFLWAPRCLGTSLTFDNPIKHPFIVLTWAEGDPLNWDECFPPRPIRDYLLGQIASIQQSLIQCTLQNGTMSLLPSDE